MKQVYYQRVPLQPEIVKRLHEHARRIIPKGSYYVPLASMAALGRGDAEAGERILHKMFVMAAPGAVHPHALRELGNGSIRSGRKVLQKFLDRAETPPADQQGEPEAEHSHGGRVDWRGGDVHYERIPLAKIIPQPDGNHGRVA
jgi:hypothetical protein